MKYATSRGQVYFIQWHSTLKDCNEIYDTIFHAGEKTTQEWLPRWSHHTPYTFWFVINSTVYIFHILCSFRDFISVNMVYIHYITSYHCFLTNLCIALQINSHCQCHTPPAGHSISFIGRDGIEWDINRWSVLYSIRHRVPRRKYGHEELSMP